MVNQQVQYMELDLVTDAPDFEVHIAEDMVRKYLVLVGYSVIISTVKALPHEVDVEVAVAGV